MNDADLTIYQAHSLERDHQKAPSPRLHNIPAPPPWRLFTAQGHEQRGARFFTEPEVQKQITEVINAALCLRRPVLVEGGPGTGKTTLAYAIALELGLPGPYRWSITSRSVLRDGLYDYDAVGRLHAATLAKHNTGHDTTKTGDFLRLGPLGMAFHTSQPRGENTPPRPAVLLIDEIDKSDMDLPNDLLHVFEEGVFEIPELQRLEGQPKVEVLPWRQSESGTRPVIENGEVRCREFPLVIMTSNGEREFPGPFLRRCLKLKLDIPRDRHALLSLVKERFSGFTDPQMQSVEKLVSLYLADITGGKRHSIDQLLNAMHMLLRGTDLSDSANHQSLREKIFADLPD